MRLADIFGGDASAAVKQGSSYGDNKLAGWNMQVTVTIPLKELCESPTPPNEVIAIGPPIMMRFCAETTRPFAIHTVVSLNTIMVDGTGMCGGCRVTVGGKVKFACVDGPEFDGHQVDFDELSARQATYLELDPHGCRLDAQLAALKKG